jgi:hypothetical protein
MRMVQDLSETVEAGLGGLQRSLDGLGQQVRQISAQ